MLVVNVTYTLKPGARDQFLGTVLTPQAAGAVRQEAGCLQYDYFAQVDDENIVLLVERWTDRQAQKVHLDQPHMALIRAAKEKYVLDTKVELFDA